MPKPTMVRLKAPDGTDEANFGEEKFRVDNDGFVLVPQAAAADLVKTGGFVLAPPEANTADAPPAPEGHVFVRHPDGGGCSFGGVTYEPEENGSVAVPAHAVAALADHGFTAEPTKA